MRNKKVTENYYLNKLGFKAFGNSEYDYYLMVSKDHIQLHFFLFQNLNPTENYGQVYIRTSAIDDLYLSFIEKGMVIHPNGKLENKPWGQREFSLLDPDSNLLTFGQAI